MTAVKHQAISMSAIEGDDSLRINPGREMMGVFCLRQALRPLLVSLVFTTGSAQAATICLSGYDYCGTRSPELVERVASLRQPLPELSAGEISVVDGGDINVGGQLRLGRNRDPLRPSVPEISAGEIRLGEVDVVNVDDHQNFDRNRRFVLLRSGEEHRPARGFGGWTQAEATLFVHEWARRQRDGDFDELRRYWHRGHHGHHGDDGAGCDDDDLPKPVPLPGAALLFAPSLLMLRAIQRRNA